jgi:hypothetical protein
MNIMNDLVIRKIGVKMIIDFTDEELDLIFECIDERRMCSDNEDEINLIDGIYKKLYEQESVNDNS